MSSCNAVMIDIETLGTPPGTAPIVEIAMVFFDTNDPRTLMEKWYMPVSLASCLDYGLVVDQKTKKWWKTQDRYYDGIFEEGGHIKNVLKQTFRILDERSSNLDEIWAKSPIFDIGMMLQVINRVGEEEDVELANKFQQNNFWKFRDVRTLVKEPGSLFNNVMNWLSIRQYEHSWSFENNHNPVSDCLYQIESVYLKRGINTRVITTPSLIKI